MTPSPEIRRARLLKHVDTIRSMEEWRAFTSALGESQPDMAADEQVRDALNDRRVELYRGERG